MVAHSPAGSRGARRRAHTHACLLNAARELMGHKGVEATTIQEITDAADVGFGSFYNHFASKDAVVDALVDDLFVRSEALLERATAAYTNPARVFSAKVRLFMGGTKDNAIFGWFIVRVGMLRERFQAGLNYRLEQDIQLGMAQGRFAVPDLSTALSAIRGATLMVIWDQLEGIGAPDAPEQLAEYLLRMLGLDATEAHTIAHLPLPDVAGLGPRAGVAEQPGSALA